MHSSQKKKKVTMQASKRKLETSIHTQQENSHSYTCLQIEELTATA